MNAPCTPFLYNSLTYIQLLAIPNLIVTQPTTCFVVTTNVLLAVLQVIRVPAFFLSVITFISSLPTKCFFVKHIVPCITCTTHDLFLADSTAVVDRGDICIWTLRSGRSRKGNAIDKRWERSPAKQYGQLTFLDLLLGVLLNVSYMGVMT